VTRFALSCGSGSGSRQNLVGEGFVCGHGPTAPSRTNGSARSAKEIVHSSSVPSTRSAISRASPGRSARRGIARRSAPMSTPRFSVRPRRDSIAADETAGKRSRVITCSVPRKAVAFTISGDPVSASFSNPASRDHSAT
jgi:hypothetical protein